MPDRTPGNPFALACIAAGVVSLAVWAASGWLGQPVPGASGTILLRQAVGAAGVTYGPFQLGRGLHRLEIAGGAGSERARLSAALREATGEENVQAGGAGGGRSEFRVEGPGPWFIRLAAELPPSGAFPADAKATFAVRAGVLSGLYPAIFGALALPAGLVCLARRVRPRQAGAAAAAVAVLLLGVLAAAAFGWGLPVAG